MEMLCPVCNKLTSQWAPSQKAKGDARAGWIFSCKTCRMVNRIHPYASYHIKRFFQYLQRLDNDPVRSALESYMENHRKAIHNDFHNQYDLGVGNSIGSLGLRMVHQALASDWTTETRGRFIEAFLASDFATEAVRTVFLNFLYHLHEACVLSSMDCYDVLRCRTADDVYDFFQERRQREAERSGRVGDK